MFNSPILEIVIGLFFVYLLLSLIATAINELIMTYLNSRGKGLMMGVQKLLDDSPARQRLSHFIFFSPQFQKLYRPGSKRIPSYLSNSRFVEIFLFSIHERRILKSLIAQVRPTLDLLNNADLPAEVKTTIISIREELDVFESIGVDEEKWRVRAGTWLREWVKSMFRRIERTSIADMRDKSIGKLVGLYEHLAELKESGTLDGDESTLEAIVELLKLLEEGDAGRRAVKTTPLTFEDVKQAIESLEEGDTKALLSSIVREADESMASFKLKLEAWYGEIMDRASAWYKRKVQIFLIFIGIGVSIAFNADTFGIVQRLSADPEARLQLVEAAIAYTQQNDAAPAPTDTTGQAGDFDVRREAVRRQIDGLIEDHIQGLSDLLGLGWAGWDDEYRIYRMTTASLDSLRAWRVGTEVVDALEDLVAPEEGWQDYRKDAFKEELAAILSPDVRVEYEPRILRAALHREGSLWNRIEYGMSHLWGWLFTSLAISLGAPFWFDMLKKVIHLRGTGRRPDTDAGRTQPVG